MYTTRYVADLLGVSQKTIQNYLNSGKITCSVRLPSGAFRFTEQDIQNIKDKYAATQGEGATDA